MGRLEYQIEAGQPDQLASRLGELFRLRPCGRQRLQRTWFDTFDWRLYRSGQVLEQDQSGPGSAVRWRRLLDGGLEAAFAIPVPRFASELCPGPLRERLHALIDVRALLPVSSMRCEQTSYVLENEEQKTVARICTEVAHAPGLDPIHRLAVESVPGYPEPVARVRSLLEHELLLTPADEDLFYLAVGATGRQPGDYSSRLRVELEPSMTSGAAARRILGQLLEKVLANLDGVRQDIDIEFLHDLRTAVRRSRAALGQFRRVLHPHLAEHLAEALRWVGQVTTPVRDLDVHQLEFEQVWPSWEPELFAAMRPVGELLATGREQERVTLVRNLASRRFQDVLDLWRRLLNQSDPPASMAPRAAEPVAELAARRIRRLHRQIRRDGGAVTASTPDEAVHDLRKLGKKLRYAIEMFQSLYPRAIVKPALGGLKELQDCLGRFNDLAVQQQAFRTWAGQLSRAPGSGGTLLAMGQMIERLRHEQHAVRDEFRQHFRAFDKRDVRRRIARLGRAPRPS